MTRTAARDSTRTGALVASKDGRLVVVFGVSTPDKVEQLIGALSAVLGSAPPVDSGVQLRRRAEVGACRIGVGRTRPGTAGVLSSYEEARTALDLADRLGLAQPVVRAADLLVYQVLLRDRAAIVDLVTTVLAPLQQARGGAEPLLEALAAYYEFGGNSAQAARSMHLSVRALTYRLERVHQLTAHDPTSSTHRFTLHTAVLGAKLLGWPAVSLDA